MCRRKYIIYLDGNGRTLCNRQHHDAQKSFIQVTSSKREDMNFIVFISCRNYYNNIKINNFVRIKGSVVKWKILRQIIVIKLVGQRRKE